MKNLVLVVLSLSLSLVFGTFNASAQSQTCGDPAQSAFVGVDESMDDSEAVAAADYWEDKVRSYFGEAGLARFEIEGEIPDTSGYPSHLLYGRVFDSQSQPYYFDDNNDSFIAWGIDHYDTIWAFDGTTWHNVGTDGQDIASGGGEVYLTKQDDSIWIWYDQQFVPFKTVRGAALRRIDASNSGQLFGVNRVGGVYFWDAYGSKWHQVLASSGENIHIALDIQSPNIIMTTSDGQAWIYEREVGLTWEKVNWARRSLATRRIE